VRIGLLTTSFPREDGDVPGLFVLGFARALAALGHEIEVLAPEPHEQRFATPPSWPGVSVHWVRYLPRKLEHTFYGSGVVDNLRHDPRAWLGLAPFMVALTRAAQARAAHWDAVVSHWALPCALIAGELARNRPIALPHLSVLHSADVHLIERLPGSSQLARRVARSARALVFSSRDLRARFLARLDPIERIEVGGRAHVSAMGIDALPAVSTSREELRRELGLSHLTVLSLGRLVPIKGLDLLIRATAELLEVELVIAGAGPERQNLERLARALGANVRFVGEVRGRAKAAWLNAADIFALASRKLSSGRTEGMPVSVIEAMERGLPVVATRAGGLADLVEHGENGLLVEPGRVDALRDAIERLRDVQLRQRFAREARMTARAYAWPELGPRFEALLLGQDAC